MRVLLDAHLSGRVIGQCLREQGHDVLAADESPELKAATDSDLLRLSAAEQRILVTCDVRHFPDLVRTWSEGGRHHAGCAVLVGMDHSDYGPILRALDATWTRLPEGQAWADLLVFVSRPSSL